MTGEWTARRLQRFGIECHGFLVVRGEKLNALQLRLGWLKVIWGIWRLGPERQVRGGNLPHYGTRLKSVLRSGQRFCCDPAALNRDQYVLWQIRDRWVKRRIDGQTDEPRR